MFNKTHLLHTKQNRIRNKIHNNFIFNKNINFRNNLMLFKFKKYFRHKVITQSPKTTQLLSHFNNNKNNNNNNNNINNNNNNNNKNLKKKSTNEQKISTEVKRTRFSFIRLKNLNNNKTDINRKKMVNILENNNYINKCMTRNGTQNKKKYFENNIINNSKYNQNNNSRVYSMNGSKAKSNVVIIGGIAYRMTRNKLTKKLPQKEVSKVKPNYSSISTSTLLPSKELLNNNNNNNNIENTTKMIEKQKIVNNCNVSNDSNNNHKCKVLLVRGIKYEMDANGKTLRQVASNGHHLRGSDGRLSRLDIGGVTYRCSKPGLFISTNAERVRQLRNRAIKSSINRILLAKRNKTYLKQMPKKHCIFYCRFGRCNEGVNCPFIHDKDKIAVCSRYIRGTCKASDCLFSHSVAPEKLPVCSFFLEGRCSSDCCPYPHVKVNSDADICKRFLCGYCPKGVQCKSAHVFVCIEFNRNGKCAKGDTCPLPHTRLGSVVAKKKRKLKTCVNFKNAKPLLDFNKDSQSQPLPSYIPLSTDNDFSSDDNSPLNVDKTDSNSCDLPSVHRKDKIQYFWVESDDENSHSNTDSDDNEENACRPTIRIIPKFLFD